MDDVPPNTSAHRNHEHVNLNITEELVQKLDTKALRSRRPGRTVSMSTHTHTLARSQLAAGPACGEGLYPHRMPFKLKPGLRTRCERTCAMGSGPLRMLQPKHPLWS